METINDRIEQIINSRFGGNKVDFATYIGIPPTSMSNYFGKERRSKISVNMIVKIVTLLKIDALWLLTGEESTKSEIHTEGAYSPAIGKGNISMDLISQSTTPDAHGNDMLLTEKIKFLEALLTEKDERIADLKERINELKTRC